MINGQQTAQIVSVWVPVPTPKPYSYLVSGDMAVEVGSIVRVPLGPRQVYGVVTQYQEAGIEAKKLRAITRVFDCPPLQPHHLAFLRFVADYTLSNPGMVVKMALRAPAAFEPAAKIRVISDSGARPQRMTAARAQVFGVAPTKPYWTRRDLAAAAKCSPAVIEALEKQGYLKSDFIEPLAIVGKPQPDFARPQLAASQQAAAQALEGFLAQDKFHVTLLKGVTGSGKTEVYFEAIAKALSQNKQVLILLPEIALTQQFIDRFAKRFGAPPAQWHSDLSASQREKVWRQTIEGQLSVIAGARSALFLPFANLGLIIVDEEHESAYKQEDGVFYHARDMAVARGFYGQFNVILCSATPSIETEVNVAEGRYQLVELKERFANAALPDIKLIDMRQSRLKANRFISPILVQAMQDTLEKQEQSLLFLNRRGYAPLTLCRVCGHRFSCPQCAAWLVEHRFRGIIMCHHCGYHEPTPEACPHCGTLDHLAACGPGVERIGEEVLALFPQARILILSADMAGGIKRLRLELAAIERGEVDIIIGTQLVAKGHHFPKISLVGVIDADLGLANGDLRAGEKTFQLLSQVTGRAGRSGIKSRALIQTYQPDYPVLKALAKGDGRAFYAYEISQRQREGLPPFGRLASLIISNADRQAGLDYGRQLARAAPQDSSISVLGPAEAPIALVRGRYRFRLLIHGHKRADLQSYIRAMLKLAPKPNSHTHLQIDIDPQSFF